MPFSVLLLTAASSERHISGYGGDRVVMPSLLPKEVVLFFDKVDSEIVSRGLGLSGEQCCDGVIFYSSDKHKVICLVEMKSSDLGDAEEQIKSTHRKLSELLKKECKLCNERLDQIIWKAYIYRSSGSPKRQAEDCVGNLIKYGFKRGNALVLGKPDITDFLRK